MNRGAELLAVWLEEQGQTQWDLAGALSCEQSTVSAWLRGKREPTLRLAQRLFEVTGIEPTTWLEEGRGHEQ